MSKKLWRLVTWLGEFPLIAVWPLALYALSWSRQMATMLVIGIIASYSLWGFVKLIYHKPRPNGKTYTNWIEKINAWSMPSVHTSNMMVVFVIGLYRTLRHSYRPNSMKFLLIIGLFGIVVAVMISRIELKYHHAVDVLVGICFWIVVALCVILVFDSAAYLLPHWLHYPLRRLWFFEL